MQILFRNNPHHSHHAERQKWFRFFTLAVWLLLLLPVKLQAGDPIPGVDVSLGKREDGIAAGFNGKVRFQDSVGDRIDVTPTNALYAVSTNTSFQVTAGNVPGDQIVIVEEDYTNDFSALQYTALGVATVNAVSNQVTIGNLGTNGQAGIVVTNPHTGGASVFELGYQPVDLSDAGAQMAFATLGEVNGSSNVVAQSLSMSNSASGRLRVRSDVSGVGATQVVVSVYLAGTLVGSTVMVDGDLGELTPDTTSYTNNVHTGYNLIANQLDHGSNTADVVFSNTGNLDFSSISKWNCTGYDVAYFDSSSPSGFSDSEFDPIPVPALAPGEGFFFNNLSGGNLSLVFTGTPHVPVLPAVLPCGSGQLNLLARQTNDLGTYENIIGLPPQQGAQVLQWNGVGYDTNTFANGAWTPTTPILAIGEAAFFNFSSATNPCITMTCSSNKTVSCGTNWDFDAPTNIVDNCCTNYSLSFGDATNSGPCPLVITRTWLVSDACGNSNICSQTVTVADTMPPIFIWPSSPNLVPNPGFESYSSCPTDFSIPGHSQLDLAAPWFQATLGTADFYHTCASGTHVGVPENIVGNQAPHGGQGYAGVYSDADVYYYDFGDFSGDPVLIHYNYCEYIETPLLATLVAGHTYTVSFYVSLADYDSSYYGPREARDNFGAYFSAAPVMQYEVNDDHYGKPLSFTPQVQNPMGHLLSSTTDWMLIAGSYTAVGGEKYLTIGSFGDHTTNGFAYYYIDDVTVREETCPNDKTLNCPTNWSFDTPTAYDACCGTNVTITMNTVTNGTAPQTFTRTWTATDCCGNSNTCSQTVTVQCVTNANAPLTFTNHGNTLELTWPTNMDWTLQTRTSLFLGRWETYLSATNQPIFIPMTNPEGYFRLFRTN